MYTNHLLADIILKYRYSLYLFKNITFTHLADAFIQSDLQCIQIYIFSMCVPWELNPQPFALLMQCSTTEPQGHI